MCEDIEIAVVAGEDIKLEHDASFNSFKSHFGV